jgi:hypothetical protein
MEPILIETGEKLQKFWTISRLILNGCSICVVVVIGTKLNYNQSQISFLIIAYMIGVAIAQFQHYLKIVTWGYGINKFGLYRYQNSFQSGKVSTLLCETVNLQSVRAFSDQKNMFKYFLEIKTPNEAIIIPIVQGEKVARDLEQKINNFIELRKADPRTTTQLAFDGLK